jgi:hypothetical protein
MDLGSILIILALAVLTIAFVSKPLVERYSVFISQKERRLSTLQAERERVLDAIQELDMDNAMGKLLQEDYDTQREILVSHGVEILKAIDGIQSPEAAKSGEVDLETEIETAVTRLRGMRGILSSGVCDSCGGPVAKNHHFCPRCGAELFSEEKP